MALLIRNPACTFVESIYLMQKLSKREAHPRNFCEKIISCNAHICRHPQTPRPRPAICSHGRHTMHAYASMYSGVQYNILYTITMLSPHLLAYTYTMPMLINSLCICYPVLCICLSICLSIHLYICLSSCLYVCLCLCLSTTLHMHDIRLSTCLGFCSLPLYKPLYE